MGLDRFRDLKGVLGETIRNSRTAIQPKRSDPRQAVLEDHQTWQPGSGRLPGGSSGAASDGVL